MNILRKLFGGDVPTDVLEKERELVLKPQIISVEKTSPHVSIVEEIHASFNSASDKMLAEAKRILDMLPPDDGHAAMLSDLGFSNALEVLKDKSVANSRRHQIERTKVIVSFHQTYPGHKFILEEQVIEICKKYSLVRADVGKYKGTVPRKNAQQIAEFVKCNPIKVEDRRYICRTDHHYRGHPHHPFSSGLHAVSYAEYKAVIDKGGNAIKDGDTMRQYGEDSKLQICAPISDMDTSRMEVDKDMKLVHVPDPIVLYPVRGGFIIVSAWGPEASDELVVNQKMN